MSPGSSPRALFQRSAPRRGLPRRNGPRRSQPRPSAPRRRQGKARFMPKPGHFILHESATPPLTAGDYVLEGTQALTGGSIEPYRGHVRVTSPRYRLPPDQLLSTYPPANAEGAFESRLPQVVLRRRTLPWERQVAPGDTTH